MIKSLYPHLELLDSEEIAAIEPKVMEGRKEGEEIIALYSPEGYTVDFGLLSKLFIEDAKTHLELENKTAESKNRILDLFTSTSLESITRGEDNRRVITTAAGEQLYAKVVIVSAGGYTPVIAQSL